MKLPFADSVIVPEKKLVDYLLSEQHPIGRTKATVLKQFGYTADNWKRLAADLEDVAKSNEIVKTEQSPFGQRFVIDGLLLTPTGKELPIRTIWFIDYDTQIPHFVTAYPR